MDYQFIITVCTCLFSGCEEYRKCGEESSCNRQLDSEHQWYSPDPPTAQCALYEVSTTPPNAHYIQSNYYTFTHRPICNIQSKYHRFAHCPMFIVISKNPHIHPSSNVHCTKEGKTWLTAKCSLFPYTHSPTSHHPVSVSLSSCYLLSTLKIS